MKSSIALGFALLFLLFAVVQYNDPDPQVWIPVYALAAGACLVSYFGLGAWRVRRWLFVLLAVGYTGAAIAQWPPAFEGFWLNEVGMKTMNVELAREAGGLAICALAMGLMAIVSAKR